MDGKTLQQYILLRDLALTFPDWYEIYLCDPCENELIQFLHNRFGNNIKIDNQLLGAVCKKIN